MLQSNFIYLILKFHQRRGTVARAAETRRRREKIRASPKWALFFSASPRLCCAYSRLCADEIAVFFIFSNIFLGLWNKHKKMFLYVGWVYSWERMWSIFSLMWGSLCWLIRIAKAISFLNPTYPMIELIHPDLARHSCFCKGREL